MVVSNSSPAISTHLITEGGPAHTLLTRLRLVALGRRSHAFRIAIILSLATWLPLVVLAFSAGLLTGGTKIPLLYDFAPHVRFLFALPILILAEIPVATRIHKAVSHFFTSGLVAPEDEGSFVALIESTIRFRDSPIATVVLLLLLAGLEELLLTKQAAMSVGTWIMPVAGGPFSGAGYWYVCFAVPVYQFLVLRWGFRIVVWGRFLSGLAKMKLRLTPIHPDSAGGILFLGRTIAPFGIVGLAITSAFAASIATRVLYAGENIYAEMPVYALLVAILLIISLGPILFFAPKLFDLKNHGIRQYGTLGTTYTLDFHARWIAHENPEHEPLLGTGDIQSLADLFNSYQIIKTMKFVPVMRSDLIAAVAPTLLPAIPLAATVVPLDQMLHLLMRVFS